MAWTVSDGVTAQHAPDAYLDLASEFSLVGALECLHVCCLWLVGV